MSESFKEISDRLLNSSNYEEIDEVNDDIKRLVVHYKSLQGKLGLAVEALSGLIFHCVDFNQGEGLFVLAMEIEKADQALKEIKEI